MEMELGTDQILLRIYPMVDFREYGRPQFIQAILGSRFEMD